MKKEDILILGLIGLGLIISSEKTTTAQTTPITTPQTEAQLLSQIQSTYPGKVIVKTIDNSGNAVYSVIDQKTQQSFSFAVVKQTMPGFPTRIVTVV